MLYFYLGKYVVVVVVLGSFVVVVLGSPKFPKVLCLGSVLMSFSLATLVSLLMFPLFKSPLSYSGSHADKTSWM